MFTLLRSNEMKSPFTNKDMVLKKEIRTLDFRKEKFDIIYHYYLCEDTGEEFEDTRLANLNFNQVLNRYREKHNLPYTEEIIAIREKYKISASRMSEILGFGTNTYLNYEKGEVPNHSNAKLIRMAEDPVKFLSLVEEAGLGHKEKSELIKKINKLQGEDSRHNLLGLYVSSKTGYRKPDFIKMQEMILFFAEIMRPFKTKMNKLLFYSDFMMFNKTGFSITGAQYRAIQYGPVPRNFDALFNEIYNNDSIDYYIEGDFGEKIIANRKFNPSVFNAEELDVITNVAEKLKTLTVNQVIELSHKEKGWINNVANKDIIDYTDAFYLNL